jgi:hypothetical protein
MSRHPTLRLLSTCLMAALALVAALNAPPAGAELPPEDECPLLGGRPGEDRVEDAIPTRLKEGMVLGATDLMKLRELIPIEVWRHREAFFFDGMRMEIGPCHRRYPVASFYERATQDFEGRPKLDGQANLRDYTAGLPFPPKTIDPEARDAGARWAWNFENRYRGSGPIGKFRIVDMPSLIGGIQTYLGTFFVIQTGHRADLYDKKFRVEEGSKAIWISGGRFDEPFNARHLAWKQIRPYPTEVSFSEPDDIFVYVPTMRKMRRAASTWVDGVFTPRYRVSGDGGGGGIAVGGSAYTGAGGSINPTSAESTIVTENLYRGFTTLALRPNAYHWRILGEREVIAPINATREGYPISDERNFGPSGLSVGSDRWDVRYAVILRGDRRVPGGEFDTLILYLDYQTQQPLFWVTRSRKGREMDVTIPVHRFSGDLSRYPVWPNGEKANVFDPVAVVSYSALEGGTGWRRESYDILSVPPEGGLRKYTSTDFLIRGR